MSDARRHIHRADGAPALVRTIVAARADAAGDGLRIRGAAADVLRIQLLSLPTRPPGTGVHARHLFALPVRRLLSRHHLRHLAHGNARHGPVAADRLSARLCALSRQSPVDPALARPADLLTDLG